MTKTQVWLREVFYGISKNLPVLPTDLWWDIQPISAGVFGVPIGFAVIFLVSLITPTPSRATQALVEHIRYPNLRPA
jgi:cation/acetate symporter